MDGKTMGILAAVGAVGIGAVLLWRRHSALPTPPPGNGPQPPPPDNGDLPPVGELETILYIDGEVAPGSVTLCEGFHTVSIRVKNNTNKCYTFLWVSWGFAMVAENVTVASGTQKTFTKQFLFYEHSGATMHIALKTSAELITRPGSYVRVELC